jgi:DNA-binding GntR family transcriptional regulator
MGALVAEADRARVAGDWKRVGTSNMDFHRAMVELCDSPRLSACFDLVLAELRLVFGQLGHTQHLHEPYIALNTALVDLLRRGETARAGAELKSYLLKSERSVLAAVQRNRK